MIDSFPPDLGPLHLFWQGTVPFRGTCMILHRSLRERSYGDPGKMCSKRSFHGRSCKHHIFLGCSSRQQQQVPLWRPLGDQSLRSDLEDALFWCLYESSSGLLIRSSWFVRRSCDIFYCIKGSSLMIFWSSLGDPGMRFWYEALMSRHCLLMPKQVPAAAVR